MATESVDQAQRYTLEQIQDVERATEQRVRREMRAARPKFSARRGELQSVFRSGGEWVAVVVAFNTERGLPVLSQLVPAASLQGNAKRKAERWMRDLA